jgi:hypothetical protein
MTEKELRALDAATKRYEAADRAHEDAQVQVIAAIVDALRAGGAPTEVAERSPFTAAYVRRIARDHDIPPAPPGIKPRKAAK